MKQENFYIRDQLGRIDRTLKRLDGCSSVTDENYHALRDAFIEFCIHCYHLKDIVIETKRANAKKTEDFINGSFYLSTCANVANKSKHLKLRNRRDPELPQLMDEYLTVGRFYNPFNKKNELKLIHGIPIASVHGSGINCREFAKFCREEWTNFLNS